MAGTDAGSPDITSGGGYSSFFPALPFMQKAIRGYLKQHSNDTSASESIISQSSVMCPAFNSSGALMRGYPDVSALAVRIPFFDMDARQLTGGTSASTPIFASYVVMMNDLRLQAGQPKLGFILPLLYMLGDQHPDVYNDVTVGYHGHSIPSNSMCCPAMDCLIGNERQGLTAAPGWDAVTGFGSINFDRMVRYVVQGSDIVSVARANGRTPEPSPTAPPVTSSPTAPPNTSSVPNAVAAADAAVLASAETSSRLSSEIVL
jgi:tripeptidyl-peptidase-1